jgi:S1-C subfamily serine protease
MIKTIGTLILLGGLLTFLTFNTSVTRLGSGFLIGNGAYIFTYYDLVKGAETLKAKFPNEDNIKLEVVFLNSASNLAILRMKETPKVKREPLVISRKGLSYRTESVFTLGYPWTNTLGDQHILIDGSANNISKLIELKMHLDPVHSGSPLFNTRHEVVGMILLEADAKAIFPTKNSHHYAIPSFFLEKTLKAAKIDITTDPVEKLSKGEFIYRSRNNIVLIEAR